MPPVLHIKLLGDFCLAAGDEPVTSVNTPRLQSLLAYLVLHRDALQFRQHLAFRFWPDSTEKQARTNLRQLLHHLRRALPDADRFIKAGMQTVQWRPEVSFTLDVDAFEQTVTQAEQAEARDDLEAARDALKEALALYRDDLLPSCYDEWIEPERERLRQQYVAALGCLVRLLEEQRIYPEAIYYAKRLVQKDPLRETTYRTLMRLHGLSGDRASALRVYHQGTSVLERELGVDPGPATREMYERLLNMQAPAERQTAHRVSDATAELPLVGRQPEWKQLQTAWRTAARGQAIFASVGGEAGIGKTRLAEELLVWAARQGVITAQAHCYAAEGRLAFGPVADWLRADAFQAALQKLDPIWRAEVARILPELIAEHPDVPRLEPLTESWQRRRFFEALARAVLIAPQPILLLIDDLQWRDQDTLEWLHYLLRFDAEARLLILGTVRIEEVGPEHPLQMLLLDLRRTAQVTEVLLGPLDAAHTTSLAERIAGRTLDAEQAAHLYRETEGSPLFVVEGMRAGFVAIEAHAAKHTSHSLLRPARPDTLPPRVHAILAARLAQLSAPARELAHLAATVGRAFTFDILAEASGHAEDTLVQSLDELWRRRIVREHGTDAYDFSHDKLREVAYAEASPVQRCRLHRRVAEALEIIYAADLDAVSGQLAAHYERARLPDRAIPHYQQAAQVAQRVYANEEAITHLNRALTLLDELPASPRRDERELELLSSLGPSVAATRGFAASETGRVYARARMLCPQGDDPRRLFPVYWGSYAFHLVRAELRKAHAFSEQCRSLAQEENDPALLVAAHFALGVSLGHLGELKEAREHLEQARAHYDPRQHHDSQTFLIGADPGTFSLAYLSHTLWLLGSPDQALQQGRDALALADELAHPFSRTIALSYLSMLHQFRGESKAALRYADATLALSAEHGFPYYQAWGTIIKGWTLHQQGEQAEGKSRMRQGLKAFRTIGTGLREPYYLTMLAEASEKEGDLEEGLTMLAEALAVVKESEERWQEAEMHRLQGELLLAQGAKDHRAEACFRQALDVARQQEARSLELRATMSLSRLWRRRGKGTEAYALLKEVYDAFTEGFDTSDLREAHALLDDLS